MKTLLEQVQELTPLAAAATEGPWMTTTINVNPRGLAMYQQAVRATETGQLGGLPAPKITMQLQFIGGRYKTRYASDGDILSQDPDDQTVADARFIAAARNFLTPANLSALAASLAPLVEGSAGEAEEMHPVYAPGGVRVTADEILRGMELALDRSYKMDGNEAYNYLYSTGQYTVQVLRKMLSATTPVGEDVVGEAKWVSVNERLPDRAHAGAHRSVPVAAYDGIEVFEATYMFTEKAWYVSAGNWKNTKVILWQPMPALPTAPLTEKGEASRG
jgi:hypothetical protein